MGGLKMGRRRGFLPPAICEECKRPPALGESLWPGDMWCCFSCLEKSLPGEDGTSKSMHKMLEYGRESRDAFELESQGRSAEGPKSRAEWAKAIAGEIFKRHDARSKEVHVSNGEAIPAAAESVLHDTLTVPDLASVEASFERTQLLVQQGPGVAAMGLDAAVSIQAKNSPEKMLAHQLAALHRAVMDQLAFAPSRYDVSDQTKCLNSAAKCMSVYQQGLETLRKLRQGGQQRITVQYVNVSEGGQAVIGSIERGSGNSGPESRSVEFFSFQYLMYRSSTEPIPYSSKIIGLQSANRTHGAAQLTPVDPGCLILACGHYPSGLLACHAMNITWKACIDTRTIDLLMGVVQRICSASFSMRSNNLLLELD
jgi:hypothetical protein